MGSCPRSTIPRCATCASSRAPWPTTCSFPKARARTGPRRMRALHAKILKVARIVAILGGLYAGAVSRHAERDALRKAAVELTPACAAKLSGYALRPGERYRSPYVLKMTGKPGELAGYTEEDVRAIERGCNIFDDLQGHQAK